MNHSSFQASSARPAGHGLKTNKPQMTNMRKTRAIKTEPRKPWEPREPREPQEPWGSVPDDPVKADEKLFAWVLSLVVLTAMLRGADVGMGLGALIIYTLVLFLGVSAFNSGIELNGVCFNIIFNTTHIHSAPPRQTIEDNGFVVKRTPIIDLST